MMRRQMPATRSAHGEAANREPIRIDGIIFLHLRDGFKHIDFAGKLERVAISSVGMQNKGVCGRKFTERSLPVREKFEFGKVIVAAMQPDIQTMPARTVPIETGGHHQTKRLN